MKQDPEVNHIYFQGSSTSHFFTLRQAYQPQRAYQADIKEDNYKNRGDIATDKLADVWYVAHN